MVHCHQKKGEEKLTSSTNYVLINFRKVHMKQLKTDKQQFTFVLLHEIMAFHVTLKHTNNSWWEFIGNWQIISLLIHSHELLASFLLGIIESQLPTFTL
jgi:hypothetical protein